jgi:hypothetical protein
VAHVNQGIDGHKFWLSEYANDQAKLGHFLNLHHALILMLLQLLEMRTDPNFWISACQPFPNIARQL